MENPFLEDGYLNLNASINKVIIAKMPTNKVKEDYSGKSAMDIFSTALFIDEIKKNSSVLKLDLNSIEEKKLPQYLNQCLTSDDEGVKKCAEKIAETFGERLGVILLVLKKGEEERSEAEKLHEHIFNVIKDTIKYADEKNINLGKNIVISIANDVKNGFMADRGGYGKLRLLSSNYEEYLRHAIQKKMNRNFDIKLIHDGSAMVVAFTQYENTVCISLGTAFGVGYPDRL